MKTLKTLLWFIPKYISSKEVRRATHKLYKECWQMAKKSNSPSQEAE